MSDLFENNIVCFPTRWLKHFLPVCPPAGGWVGAIVVVLRAVVVVGALVVVLTVVAVTGGAWVVWACAGAGAIVVWACAGAWVL